MDKIFYEVLSPWAEADPVKLHGVSPRLKELSGKKLGLFCNSKRAARLILSSVEKKLKEKFSDLEITWYEASEVNVPEMETKKKSQFMDWIKGIDAVILAVGD